MLKTSNELLSKHLIDDLAIENNALVWAHIGVKGLGILEEGLETITSSFNKILTEGSLVLPTFTYSWCNNNKYNNNSIGNKELGVYSNYVVNSKKFNRNQNPNFSVAVMDNSKEKNIEQMMNKKSTELTCFGKGSVFDNMYEYSKSNPAYILLLGGAHDDVIFRTTFMHYIEEKLDVPYRFSKKFYNPDDKSNFVTQFVRCLSSKEFYAKNTFSPPKSLGFPITCKFNSIGLDIVNEQILKSVQFQYSTTRMVPMFTFCNWLEKKIRDDPYYLLI